jgi:hypothetical protein
MGIIVYIFQPFRVIMPPMNSNIMGHRPKFGLRSRKMKHSRFWAIGLVLSGVSVFFFTPYTEEKNAAAGGQVAACGSRNGNRRIGDAMRQ